MEKMTINDFVKKFFSGNKSEFARSQSVPKTTITKWINADYFMLVDGNYFQLCKIMREGKLRE